MKHYTQEDFDNELAKGLSNEDKVYNFLLSTSKYHKLKKFKDNFSLFDFYGRINHLVNKDYKPRKIFIEVKSRNNLFKHYDSTMLGFNKILKLKKKERVGHFYFLFQDGLYLWDYKEGEYEVSRGGRIDRNGKEIKNYAYIPIKNLRLITTEINSL